MNPQQAGFVSQYPPQQGFQFPYPYAPPTGPVQYQYPPQHPPPPQPIPRQQGPQQPQPQPQAQQANQFQQQQQQQQQQPYFQAFRPAGSSGAAAVSTAPQVQPQLRSQSAQPVHQIHSSPPALPPADAVSGAAASEPNGPDANDQDDNENGENDEEHPQYGPHGNDEHGAIFNIPPPPEDTYPNEEELEKAIHAWSKEHGYELVRRASKRNAKGVLYKRYYHCSKHGKRANTGKLTDETRQRVNRKSGRVDCPMSLAAVAVDPTNPEGEWQIRHRKTHHNHGPSKAVELAGHRRRARGGAVEQAIDGLFAIGTSTAQVLQFLQRTNPEGLFTRTDVANMKNRYKKWGTCADRIQRGENHISTVRYKSHLGIPIPCIPCRQRKWTCGSERPSCKNCQQKGFQCEYSHDVANNDAEEDDSTQIDQSADLQLQQENSEALQPAPAHGPTQPTPQQTEQILNSLKNFQAEYIQPQRLALESSSVQVLAQSSCGNGDSYKGLPFLNSEWEWIAFRNAMTEAALKENTHDVLTGWQKEPQSPANAESVEIETWNEYIKQLAIYHRRNGLLLSALLSKTSPMFRNKIQNMDKAHQAWDALEEMCAPRGSDAAYRLYCDLHSIALVNSNSLQNYIARLDSTYTQFRQLRLNTGAAAGAPFGNTGPTKSKRKDTTTPGAASWSQVALLPHTGSEAMTDEMMVFLFLRGLGPEWQRWVETLCLTSNIAGFGTGDRLGFKEVCKAVLRQDVMARRAAAAAAAVGATSGGA